MQNSFDEYWEKGGFPEVRNVSKRVRRMIHQEYFKTIIHRDVIERYDTIHPQAVVELSYRLINNVRSRYSINRLTEFLKSLNYKISKTFISQCLVWFEDAYFMFSVMLFDSSLSRQKVNPKKIYCIDHALVPSVASGIMINSGHLLENLVFCHLRRQSTLIYFYRTSRGREVDFIWIDQDSQRHLVQTCESFSADTTRKREIRALQEAMAEQDLAHATIVTRNETESIIQDGCSIDVIPAWKFLLNHF